MSELALNSPLAGLQPAENETANIETALTESQADGSSMSQLPAESQQSAIVKFFEQPASKTIFASCFGFNADHRLCAFLCLDLSPRLSVCLSGHVGK